MKDLFEKLKLLDMEDYFNFAKNSITYGWVDKDGNKHLGTNNAESYSLQSPEELLESRTGICWDLTELSRAFFESMTDYKFETYYLFYDDNAGCPSHTFLVFYKNDMIYLFEPMYFNSAICYNGIHEYETIQDLILDATKVFIENMVIEHNIPENYDIKSIFIYKYEKPRYHINGFEMRNHINLSRKVEVLYDRKSL